MNVYPIPSALDAAYRGAGHALAAIKGGVLVDLIYLRDLLPDFDPDARRLFLGSFESMQDAIDARRAAEARYDFGPAHGKPRDE